MTTPELMTVDAEPTKDFFISMLTRDIDLKDAVVDLVDNSVDGARRLRPGQDFAGLWVRLNISEEAFEIVDNCGGMSIEVARKYAFRFGRDSRTPKSFRSIGQFGVGMKRTLFKLGTHFVINSQTVQDSFTLDVPVNQWRREPKWDFTFQDASTGESRDETETGTTITVTELHAEIAETINDDEWQSELEDDVRLKHGSAIRNGLTIELNGDEITVEDLVLLSGPGLSPGVWRHTYEAEETETGDETLDTGDAEGDQAPISRDVEVRLLVGVADRKKEHAGWYVFCNGRLVLGPDRTRTTTWGVKTPARIPIYHDQFARFRGYAFFESDDPSRLPWTTTKTGVDVDNAIWKSARAEMIQLSRPVIDFLNLLDRQNTAAGGWELAASPQEQVSNGAGVTAQRTEYAERVLQLASPLDVESAPIDLRPFEAPEIDKSEFPTAKVRIAYMREEGEVEAVRRRMGLNDDGSRRTNADVGDETFDYYLRNEVVD